jgi:hypothetical protein
MVSDLRAEMRSLNRRVGLLIALLLLVAIIGIVAATILINRTALPNLSF